MEASAKVGGLRPTSLQFNSKCFPCDLSERGRSNVWGTSNSHNSKSKSPSRLFRIACFLIGDSAPEGTHNKHPSPQLKRFMRDYRCWRAPQNHRPPSHIPEIQPTIRGRTASCLRAANSSTLVRCSPVKQASQFIPNADHHDLFAGTREFVDLTFHGLCHVGVDGSTKATVGGYADDQVLVLILRDLDISLFI